MQKTAILCDDLTGGMDSGLQFCKRGAEVVLFLDPRNVSISTASQQADVLVADTDSRNDSPLEAYRKTAQAAETISNRWVYKKVDSTLRGNIGAELDAVLDACGVDTALVSPAYPVAGRTTSEGQLLVNGIPLLESELQEDALCPPTGHIPSLLQMQSHRPVHFLSSRTAQQGASAIKEAADYFGHGIIVVDAENEQQLAAIVQAAIEMDPTPVLCGSAGLSEQMAARFPFRRRKGKGQMGRKKNLVVLTIAGSRNPTTLSQIEYAVLRDVCQVIYLSAHSKRQANLNAVNRLKNGEDVILMPDTSAFSGTSYLAGLQILASAVVMLLEEVRDPGLILTGGLTARKVCREAGITQIRIYEQVLPGIPMGTALDGPFAGLQIITKAGGFGGRNALTAAIRYLKGTRHES